MLTRLNLVPLIAVLVVAASLFAFWPRTEGFDRPILLVSGRDEHGLLTQAYVSLLDEPEGQPVGAVADGGLVEVFGADNEWLRVRTLEGAAQVEGWVNDYYLRGTVHVVLPETPGCPVPLVGEPDAAAFASLRPSEQVVLLDRHVVGDTTWLGVRTVQGDEVGLIPREWIGELAGPPVPEGTPCEEVEVDPAAPTHRH